MSEELRLAIYYEKGIDAEPPKAWCKVPTFEE